jgi:3-dehydroquinate synthase II
MMMKTIILNFERKKANFNELIQEALNCDILNFYVSELTYRELKEISRINFYGSQDKIFLNNVIFENIEYLTQSYDPKVYRDKECGLFFELKDKYDEEKILKITKEKELDFIIVKASDWKIIPFENLIAKMHKYDTKLMAFINNVEDAELMFKVLEIGVDGLFFEPENIADLILLKNLLQEQNQLKLITARITKIQKISESERVCVDTTSILRTGEGMLIGSTSKGFVLVHAETIDTQFVPSRPFRVNAGDVSAYILVPPDEENLTPRTKYLSELKGGDRVLVVNWEGKLRNVSVGRVKIETRPMLRFELEARLDDRTIEFSCICQNAETIRLVKTNGDTISVVDLDEGDEVLAFLGPGATHFGTAINENIMEK